MSAHDLFSSSEEEPEEVSKVSRKPRNSQLLGDSSDDDNTPKNDSATRKQQQETCDDELFSGNKKVLDKASNLLGAASSDEESEPNDIPRVKSTPANNNLMSSSDDDSVKAEKKQNSAGDIFGDDDDDLSEEEKPQPKAPMADTSTRKSNRAKVKPTSNDQEQIKPFPSAPVKLKERPSLKTVDVKLPQSHQIPPGYDGILLRLPQFLGINPDAFNANEYIKPKIPPLQTAVIRCKYEEGSRDLLSNSRLLKWDDGSYQLVVADQVFNARLAPTSNVFIFEQERAELTNTGEEPKRTTVLECNGSVSSKITVMPTSLHSESHAKMSIKLLEQYKKEDKIQMLNFDDLKNPDQTMQDLAKREEEEIRKKTKELNAQRDQREPTRPVHSRRIPFNSAYMEVDEQYSEPESETDDFIVYGEEGGNEDKADSSNQPMTAADNPDEEPSSLGKRSSRTALEEDNNNQDEPDAIRYNHKRKKGMLDSDSEKD